MNPTLPHSKYQDVPELLLGCPWDYRVDTWRVGLTVISFIILLTCQLLSLLTGEPFLIMGDQEELGAERSTLRQIINYFGEIPGKMIEQSKRMDDFVEKDARITRVRSKPVIRGSPYHHCLERRLWWSLPGIGGKQIAKLTDFLRLFLQIDPDERASFDEIQHHRWLDIDVPN